MAAANEWAPDEGELQQVLLLLQHSQSADSEVQRAVQQSLAQLSGHERFGCYLAYILGVSQNEVATRSLAGLILKNNMRTQWIKLAPDVKDYIWMKVISAIGDDSQLIRATVGIILTTMVVEEGIEAWPRLLPTLKELLHCGDRPLLQEGALGAIQKIFEDSGDRLDRSMHIEPIVPHILPFFSSPNPRMRGMAMNSLNCILMVHEEPIPSCIDEFLNALFQRAQDDDQEVIKQLCRSLTLLLESHVDKMIPFLPNVIEYLIQKTSDPSEAVALEACEFWLALAENNQLAAQLLGPFLPKLVPVLVACMKYSHNDIIALRANDESEDAMVPDRAEDMKPRFHRSKAVGGDDDDDDDDDTSTEWSVRKCAAASLDVLSSIFREQFLPHLLPILKEMLFHPQWEVRESAVLALGAIAEGCLDGMMPHLPELIPFLIGLLEDKKALIRSITCWTLSRYCHFVVECPPEQYFEPLLKLMMHRILDGNKRVQEAACSAFATLEEEANLKLVPYLGDILRTLVTAFGYYQAKNLLILYDAIGTLAESVGAHLSNPEYVEILMPPLMNKLQTLPNDDRELFPLLECVTFVATALVDSFVPFCPTVFARCAEIINRCLEESVAHERNPESVEAPDKDFLIVGLDLISGLISSCPHEHIHPLVEQTNLVHIIYRCANDTTHGVRQSAFAVLGDLVKSCYDLVQPFVHNFLPILGGNLDPEFISVCNNSTWALGELSLRMKGDMKQYAAILVPPLVQVINRQNLQKTLMENTAMTLGRLGIYCTEEVAPHLKSFVRCACFALRNIRDNSDKETAFKGLCLMVNINPQGVIHDFVFLCDAIASWSEPPAELKNMFRNILFGFKSSLGDANWALFTAQFPEPLRQRLAVQYSL